MASHLASLSKWDFLELGNGLFNIEKSKIRGNVSSFISKILKRLVLKQRCGVIIKLRLNLPNKAPTTVLTEL